MAVVLGRISLSLSMANVLIACISAVGVLLFPMLRGMEREQLFAMYVPTRHAHRDPRTRLMSAAAVGSPLGKGIYSMAMPARSVMSVCWLNERDNKAGIADSVPSLLMSDRDSHYRRHRLTGWADPGPHGGSDGSFSDPRAVCREETLLSGGQYSGFTDLSTNRGPHPQTFVFKFCQRGFLYLPRVI